MSSPLKPFLNSILASITPVTVLLSVLCILTFTTVQDVMLWRKMPPGPQPLPIIGNKLLLHRRWPWIQLEELSKKYGGIFTIWIGRRPTIVISDPHIAIDLMEKRSNIYSARPRLVVLGELYMTDDSILVQGYNDKWRKQRKILHQALVPRAISKYKVIQDAESKRLLWDIYTDPTYFETHLNRYAASVVMCIAYARRIDSMESKVMHDVNEAMEFTGSLNVPGAFLAETFPFLKYVPTALAKWKQTVQKRSKEDAEFFGNLALEVKQREESGKQVPHCFVKSLVETSMKELSFREFAWVTQAIFGAGADTTSATLNSFILAITVFPEALKGAHEELDSVVGSDRLPTFDDEENLPYIRAMVKETLRWRPVAVLGGTPHGNTADDYYDGYLIPKGTTILGNLWAINHSPVYYPNPHTFDPRRFLGAPEYADAKPFPADKTSPSFGWGRRICPGEHLATNSVFITIAKICWAFTVRKYVDENGTVEVPDTYAYTDGGFNIRPLPFRNVIEIRDPGRLKVIEKGYHEAEEFLNVYEPYR